MMHTITGSWRRLRAFLLKLCYRLYCMTFRVTISGLDDARKCLHNSSSGAVFLLWHDSLVIGPFLLEKLSRKYPLCFMISKSRDGAIPSDFAMQFKNFSVLRVGHKERARALVRCCKLLSQGTNLVLTPDGPRGPRRKLKPGALFAAKKANAPLIPVVYTASKVWTLKSWDKFQIPKPFSHLHIALLPPVDPSIDPDTIARNMIQGEPSL